MNDEKQNLTNGSNVQNTNDAVPNQYQPVPGASTSNVNEDSVSATDPNSVGHNVPPTPQHPTNAQAPNQYAPQANQPPYQNVAPPVQQKKKVSKLAIIGMISAFISLVLNLISIPQLSKFTDVMSLARMAMTMTEAELEAELGILLFLGIIAILFAIGASIYGLITLIRFIKKKHTTNIVLGTLSLVSGIILTFVTIIAWAMFFVRLDELSNLF